MLAALVPAYAIAILVPGGPDDGCPSPRQVDDALTAHLPGMVLPLGHATGSTTLHLAVTTDAAGAMRLDLTNPDGGPLLHRWFPAAERGHGGDCLALAETAALIVDRYWHEVGYDVAAEPPNPPRPPPPPPVLPPRPDKAVAETSPAADEIRTPSPPPPPLPSPRWWLGAVGNLRLGDTSAQSTQTAYESTVAIALTVEHPIREHRLGLRLSGGTGGSATYRWTSTAATTDRATLRQFPLRMGAYLALPLGPGQLEPGLGIDLDVISASVTDMTGSGSRLNASPGLDAAVGWALQFRPRLYLRALAEAGIEVPYHFVTTPNQTPFWSTPRVYVDLGLELGFWFP